jgi:hypothetical protein
MATATLDAPFALEAATATATSVPLLPPLPFTLDLSCPLPLPQPRVSRPAFASEWPFPVA